MRIVKKLLPIRCLYVLGLVKKLSKEATAEKKRKSDNHCRGKVATRANAGRGGGGGWGGGGG